MKWSFLNVFWNRAEKPLPAVKEFVVDHRAELTLVLRAGSRMTWTTEVLPEKPTYPFPWYEFARWYFGRRDSSEYVLEHADGATSVRRAEIDRFEYRALRALRQVEPRPEPHH